MLEAIVTSDWHFDGLRNHFPLNHAKIVGTEVSRVYQYAVEHGIKHVFVPGDIADSYKISPDSVQELLGILATYDSQVTTYYMKGNHDHGDVNSTSLDIFKSMAQFKMLKNFHVITDRSIMEIDGVTINFCAFPHKELLPTNRPSINFIHQDIDGAVGDTGRVLRVKNEIDLDTRSFTFGGHIHKHQYIKSKNLVLVGNLYQKTFGESGEKGFVVFKAKYKDKKLKVNWNYIPQVPRFKLETVSIDTQEDFSKLKAVKNIRYRLYVADGVVVPLNLRRDIPNIDQIWEYTGKKIKHTEEIADKLSQEVKDIPKIDPTLGLKDYFKANGLKKNDYALAATKVQHALARLGI